MNTEELELVTAYLDGEATPLERARVEADPELLAEVEHQRTARDLVHDVEPPTDAARESALAAALAVFDHEFAPPAAAAAPASGAAVTAPTNIVPFQHRRRQRWMQSLGAAAAVAAIAVAGAVIATRGGDDDSTADEVRQVTTVAADTDALGTEAPAPPAAPVEATGTTSEQAILMATEPTEVTSAADEAGELEAADAAVATTEPAAGALPGEAPPTTQMPSAAMPSPTSTRFVVQTTDDLLELAGTIKAALPERDAAEASCEDGSLKADAIFEDDEGVVHAIVVVAVDDDTVGALTLEDCDVVLQADR